MANNTIKYHGNIIIHTGNILNINEVKRKAGQNPTEELVESLNYVINRCNAAPNETKEGTIEMNKNADYHELKLDLQEERKDVKVTAKIFVRHYEVGIIKEALLAGFHSLNTPVIESVVLALRGDDPLPLQTIKSVWLVLEEFVITKKVCSIGVSDIETDVFISLYEWAKVKPGIVQINLAHCCVVPPALQNFTREHEVQLLTHSDPIDILPDSALRDSIIEQELPLVRSIANESLLWATRYQVHIKCRGVLSSKGYILCLTK